MKSFHLFNPTRIVFGNTKLEQLQQFIPANWHTLMIVTDKIVALKSGALNSLKEQFSHLDLIIFQEIEENPCFATVDKGSSLAIQHRVDGVVGVGGGSVLDAAKAIALVSTNTMSARELIEGARVQQDPLPIFCLPTTSGTGSEVTPYIVLTDKENHNKCGYGHDKLFPRLALVDPRLTFSMPKKLVVSTGLDALTHAVEAYLCTESFPFNDLLAINTINMVIKNLILAAEKEEEAMAQMAYAAMIAGITITNSGTILPHIMGYPLTTFHSVPHGTASAVTLPRFLSFLEKKGAVQDKLDTLKNIFARVGGLDKYLSSLDISTNLADYGVDRGEIEAYIQKTIVKGDIQITPAPVTAADIGSIYNL